jgi:hypothetical protein
VADCKVTKPFEEGTAFDRRYEIALKSEKIFDTAPVSLTVETIAPVGAIVPAVTTTLVNSLTAMQFDITSKTVAGLYTHKITLDGRLIEIKVEVVNPVTTIEFAQQTVSGVKFDVTSAGVGVKLGADGVYEIEAASSLTNHLLFARVSVADMPVGVYAYKVVKSYPDGRVETIQDNAQITAVDDTGIAVFGTATAAGVDNTKFVNNFLINEPNASFEKGLYTYEFTFGTITRNYKISIIDRPQLSISKVLIGSASAATLGGIFTFETKAYTAADVTIEFTKKNALDSYFVSLAETTDEPNLLTINTLANGGDTASSTAKVQLSDSKTLLVGALAAGTPATDQYIRVTIRLWKKVDYSVSGNRYELVGEPEVLTFGFLNKVTLP